MHQQINVGDTVLLVFSDRGLDQFKAQWGQVSDPPPESFFDERDALAIPWGVENIAPVRATGWVVQTANGMAYISLDGDTIRIFTADSSVVLTPSEIRLAVDQSNISISSSAITMQAATITLSGASDTLVVP